MIIPACFAQRASPAEMAAPFGSSRLGVGLVTALVWALTAGSALCRFSSWPPMVGAIWITESPESAP